MSRLGLTEKRVEEEEENSSIFLDPSIRLDCCRFAFSPTIWPVLVPIPSAVRPCRHTSVPCPATLMMKAQIVCLAALLLAVGCSAATTRKLQEVLVVPTSNLNGNGNGNG
jgi:hypothetical protein